MPKVISILINSIFVAGGILDPSQAALITAITDEILSITIVISILAFSIAMPILLRTINRRLDAARIRSNFECIDFIAMHSVKSADQIFENGAGVAKYEYAAKILNEFVKSTKIDHFTPDLCRMIIESCVKKIKSDTSEKSA